MNSFTAIISCGEHRAHHSGVPHEPCVVPSVEARGLRSLPGVNWGINTRDVFRTQQIPRPA